MKKVSICIFLVSILLCACAPQQTEVTNTTAMASDDAPITQVLDYFTAFCQMQKTDPKGAIEMFTHYESQEEKALGLKYCYRVVSVEILRVEKLSEQLWEIEYFHIGEGIAQYGIYDVDYVGIVDGEYKIMFMIDQIPAYLKEGVEIEPYVTHGLSIVNPEDIVGGLGEHVIGTQPAQP